MQEEYTNLENDLKSKNKKLLYVSIVILVLIILSLFMYFKKEKYEIKELGEDYEYVVMQEWQMPFGFPPDILVFQAEEVKYLRGEDTNVGDGEIHKIIELYLKGVDSEELAMLYKNKLQEEVNGWTLLNEQKNKNTSNLLFSRGMGILVVSTLPYEEGSLLNLTYIIK
jgi:hypothetical protein